MHKFTTRSWGTRPTIVAAAVVAVAAAGTVAATSATAAGEQAPAAAKTAAPTFKDGEYIVVLRHDPLASYSGDVSGYAATRPAAGRKLDLAGSAATRYRAFLKNEQDQLITRSGAKVLTRYSVALNGFAARLTGAQAAALSKAPGVLEVAPNKTVTTHTTETPALLGLSGKNGLWSKLGGQANAGNGVVVGVIDSGYTPESPSFAGKPVTAPVPQKVGVPYRTVTGRIAMKKSDGNTFTGLCQAGQDFPATTCNSKVISARYYRATVDAAGGPSALVPEESLSPRDGNSHGTHTGSTAVGNPVSHVKIRGVDFGSASGMAPGAKLAVYKALWSFKTNPSSASGSFVDIISAIDQAVADGVDVINYSVGGGSSFDLDDLAFLHAAAAGVFVSASAGNSGPAATSVEHQAPWLTTVAATTAHRFEGTVVLGNGKKYLGVSLSRSPLPSAPLVLAASAAVSGDAGKDAAKCAPNSLDPSAVTGKIVVCDRGVYDRVAKSAEVKRAGGVGMILTNVSPNSLDPDVHSVPTVHVDEVAGAAIKAYVASTATPTASFAVGNTTGSKPTPLPQIAGFSSRGPAEGTGADLVKPDIAAPGVGIIAAVAPSRNEGDFYGPESGTSMSAPHIAGLAALFLQVHPQWSPAVIKSAMMTTATDLLGPDGKPVRDPFAQGAGFVNPRRFLTPGLVYDAGVNDYLAYLEGQGLDTQSGVKAIDASDVNVPSIGIGALAGKQTVTRRVTAFTPGTYRASIAVPGVTTTVSPKVLTFTKAGQTKSFTVTFTRAKAALGAFGTGSLTWTGPKGLTVRSPVAVRPVAVAAPAEVQLTGTSGTGRYTAQLGVSPLALTVKGLTAGTSTPSRVAVGAQTTPPVANASNIVSTFEVPAGTTLARIETVDARAGDDIDLYVYDAKGNPVGVSAGGSANERVDLLAPAAGTYTVQVVGFAAGTGTTVDYALRTFAVGTTAAGNLTVSPSTLKGALGAKVPVTLTWSGLTANTPYLGWVGYGTSGQVTIVSVN
ncbi:MAG TPA: S8 family serine peptidase [Kineosporiaceae bacterium]|nr:S8 family serine peptidase [Kineosporiaceae bacterium]